MMGVSILISILFDDYLKARFILSFISRGLLF